MSKPVLQLYTWPTLTDACNLLACFLIICRVDLLALGEKNKKNDGKIYCTQSSKDFVYASLQHEYWFSNIVTLASVRSVFVGA